MSPFERVLSQTEEDYREHIARNPLFELVAQGGATMDKYVIYLRETYHLVRHTSRALALGAARLDDSARLLRAWLIEQAHEEHGHELFCLKDISNLGLNADEITATHPGPGAWGVVTQNYFMASYGNPVGLLGVASATEGMGADLAGSLAKTLTDRYGIPQSATTFLRSHSGFDQKHYEETQRAVSSFGLSDADLLHVAHARRMTLRYYGQIFSEVATSTARFPRAQTSLAA